MRHNLIENICEKKIIWEYASLDLPSRFCLMKLLHIKMYKENFLSEKIIYSQGHLKDRFKEIC